MAMNTLTNLYNTLVEMKNMIEVDEATRQKALVPLNRMLDFSYQQGILTAGDA
jgi:quinolinate synthase